MIKTADASSYNFQDIAPMQVKCASSGLRGNDRLDFIKRAGHEFAEAIDQTKLAPDEVMVHLPIVGATEWYGANRNFDGFKKAACRKYHETFVKLGRLYRDHDNEDPKNSYGRIIASTFREPLGRIELLVGYNGSEKTAAVNGGHVADREMQKLANGRFNSISMACRVTHDQCSGCGHKARNRDEYCDAAMCKYGGLRDNMGAVSADGHVLHADNPHPFFFDCSDVPKPAERIANALGIVKQAGLTDHGWSRQQREYLDLYNRGQLMQSFDQQELAVLEETVKVAQAELPPTGFCLPPAGYSADEALGALAQQKILLPPEEYLYLASGNARLAKTAAAQLQPYLPALHRTATNTPSPGPLAPSPFQKLAIWAAQLAPAYSLDTTHVINRTTRAALHGLSAPRINSGLMKTACENTSQLLDAYRDYQRGFLDTVSQQFPQDFSAVRLFMIRRNKLS